MLAERTLRIFLEDNFVKTCYRSNLPAIDHFSSVVRRASRTVARLLYEGVVGVVLLGWVEEFVDFVVVCATAFIILRQFLERGNYEHWGLEGEKD